MNYHISARGKGVIFAPGTDDEWGTTFDEVRLGRFGCGCESCEAERPRYAAVQEAARRALVAMGLIERRRER